MSVTPSPASKALRLAALFAALASGRGAAAQAEALPKARGPGGIVAIVNQDVITRRELDRGVITKMEDFSRSEGLPLTLLERDRSRFERAVLDWLIEKRLLLQDAKRKEIPALDAEVDAEIARRIEQVFRPQGLNVQDAEELYRFLRENYGYSREEYRQLVRDEILINRLLWTRYFQEIFVTPGERREYYFAHPEEFETPAELAFRMIVVDPSELAPRILDDLDRALEKQPFVDVAREYAVAQRQGQEPILWRKTVSELKEWKAPLPDVLAKMKPGEVQKRVRAPNGWRYLEMVEVKPGKRKSFDEAQAEIEESIHTQARRQQKEKAVRRLREEAHIQDFLPPAPREPEKPPAAAAKPGEEPAAKQPRDVSPDPAAPRKDAVLPK